MLSFGQATSYASDIKQDKVVKQFKKTIENYFAQCPNNPRIAVTEENGSYLRSKYAILNNYKYDVKKSDSLISPYVGYLEFVFKTYAYKKFDSKEDAYKDNSIDELIITKTYQINYGYQDGKWVATSGEYKLNMFNEEYPGMKKCSEKELSRPPLCP